MNILMIDIGGSNVKMMISGGTEMRKFPSGRGLTAADMVKGVKVMTSDWNYDAISMGFPGLVEKGRLVREPLNLSGGWLNFDFAKAFGKPVKIINDAAMQALAHYQGGRMLFVGFGTSVGAAMVVDGVIMPVELGLIPLRGRRTFMKLLTKEARRRNGHERWQRHVHRAVALLKDVFWPGDTVIGGGNAKHLDPLPEGCRRSCNQDAIHGAVRLWKDAAHVHHSEVQAVPLRTRRVGMRPVERAR
ncbi:ROK family protein [Prosthecobacter sp.]|uniref:ROK family protein n=1 Tax=Prosthecobacter sp. TaxID=1965333 RepID=UPI0037840768